MVLLVMVHESAGASLKGHALLTEPVDVGREEVFGMLSSRERFR